MQKTVADRWTLSSTDAKLFQIFSSLEVLEEGMTKVVVVTSEEEEAEVALLMAEAEVDLRLAEAEVDLRLVEVEVEETVVQELQEATKMLQCLLEVSHIPLIKMV